MKMVVLLRLNTLVLIGALLKTRCEAQDTGDAIVKDYSKKARSDDPENSKSNCMCSDGACECCSLMGPARMCNVIRLVNLKHDESPGLELSVKIGLSKIFSQTVTLKELEPICSSHGDYNFCIQADLVKNQQGTGNVCGNFLAKQNGFGSAGESSSAIQQARIATVTLREPITTQLAALQVQPNCIS